VKTVNILNSYKYTGWQWNFRAKQIFLSSTRCGNHEPRTHRRRRRRHSRLW